MKLKKLIFSIFAILVLAALKRNGPDKWHKDLPKPGEKANVKNSC